MIVYKLVDNSRYIPYTVYISNVRRIMANYKTVQLSPEDHEYLNTIRKAWVKEHKAEISLAQMIKIAMDEYKERNLV